ncbi:MAG: permease, partial [Deltaproteobacteria bacterium]|nr:permease [Deltaproteobacteria bacterium]
LIGGFIEEFVPREKLALILPEGKLRTVFIAAGMGIVFPVCECAIIPVVRRLLKKGVPFSAAVAFMLGVPIFNPVVFASTFVAYRFDWTVPITRISIGYGIAVVLGALTGFLFKGKDPLLKEAPAPNHTCEPSCPSDHFHGGRRHSRLIGALVHAGDDFVDVARFLVIGAFVASLIQSAVDRSTLVVFVDHPLMSLIPMMVLAIVLNLCSEADAFVAASFRFVIPLEGQMAFMVLGPMLDIKLIFMYLGVFRKSVIVVLGSLILIAVLIVMAALSIFGLMAG